MSGRVLNESTSFLIDTRYRDLTTPINNFTYTIDLPSNHSYDSVALISAHITRSWYLCQDSRNNTDFVLDEGGNQVTIHVPEGDYNINSFIYVMTNLLNGNSPNNFVYSITYPNSAIHPQTQKFDFNVTGNSGVQPALIFNNYSKGLTIMFGFNNNSTNSFVADWLTSDRPVRMMYTRYVVIKSNCCANPGVAGDNTIMSTIAVGNTPQMNMISYVSNSLDESSKKLINGYHNTFTFSLLDEFGELLDTNEINYQFTIMFYQYNYSSDYIINDLTIKYLDDQVNTNFLNKDPTEI